MHTNSGSPSFKRFALEARAGNGQQVTGNRKEQDSIDGLALTVTCYLTSVTCPSFKNRVLEARVTAYLLYNGSATYVL